MISNGIAYQLNEKGGGIKVKSEFGKGSTFSFKIIDLLIEEKDCLTASDHFIENIFKMECKLIKGTTVDTQPITMTITRKNTSINDSMLDRRSHEKRSNSSITSKNSKRIVNNSFIEKSLRSISSKYNSKTHFFFAEAGTFRSFISPDDVKSKESLIERKKEFITQQMHQKCSCPYILAVDDNDFNNLTMTMLCRRLDIPIITALSGDEALQKIEEQESNPCCDHFKLIFMDIEMPIMDGFETFQIIKQLYEEKKRELCVIGITGHNEGSEKVEKVKELMGTAIIKPFCFEYLVIFLEKYIKEVISKNQIREN